MKRWMAIILATVTLASLLVGCNNSTSASNSYVTVWLISEHIYHDSGGKFLFTYDSNGYLIKEEHYNNDELSSQTEYEYNSNGQLIKETYSGKLGIYNYETNYAYDSNGNKSTAWHYPADGDDYIEQYTYDEHGNPIREEKNYQTVRTWEYQYDNSGNILKETRYDLSTDQRHVYMYDSSGNEYAYIFYREGELYRQEEHTFDDDGKQISSLWYIDPEDEFANLFEYSYDINGNKIKETEYYYNLKTDTRTLHDWTEYTYDENGCRTSTIDSDGDTTDTYTYIEMQLTAEQVEKMKNNPNMSYLMVIKE